MLFINSTNCQGQEIKIFLSSDSNTIPLCEAVKKLETANLGKISGERYASKYFIYAKNTSMLVLAFQLTSHCHSG